MNKLTTEALADDNMSQEMINLYFTALLLTKSYERKSLSIPNVTNSVFMTENISKQPTLLSS